MDLSIEQFLAKSTIVTVFSDVYTPFPDFSTTTASRTKEELGPGWAVDDVYPPLAELRQALLTDEEWAAMSSWEKDVWEMFFRADWERLACIEQILQDTPAAQRAQRHEEILEALRCLGASSSKPTSTTAATSYIGHVEASNVVPVDTASSTIIEKGPKVVVSASNGFITTVPVTCSTDCSPQQSAAAPVLVASSPPTPTEYILDINNLHVAAVSLAMTVEFPTVLVPTVFTPMFQMQQLYNGSEFFMTMSGQCITGKVTRPMPWLSFMGVHVDGVEARPLPWPSFGKINGCEFPSDAVEKASWRCNYASSSATLCDVIKFSVTDFSELKESVVLNLLRSSSNYVLCDEWLLPVCDSGQQAAASYDQLSCAIQNTSCFPEHFINNGQIQVTAACSTWQLFLSGYSISFILARLVVRAKGQYGVVLYASELSRAKLVGRCREFEIWWNHMLQCWLPWGLDLMMGGDTTVLAYFHNGQTLITLHKQQAPVQAISTELSFRVPNGRYSLDMHSVISLNGSGILSHLVLLCCRGEPHGIGCLWEESPHADSSFIRINKMPQTRQSLHDHCSTRLQNAISVMRWINIVIFSECNTPLTESVITEQLTLDGVLLIIQEGRMDITKCSITACFRYRILASLAVATHLAVHSSCPTDRQLDLEKNTTWYPDSMYCMIVVSNPAFINMKLLLQSDDIHLQLWPLHIFSPEDELISRAGIFVLVILRVDCHWWNCTKDQWLYFSSCAISDADLSSLAICEAWLLNYQVIIQMQIASRPRAHACLTTNEMAYTHTESLCGYPGRHALLSS